MPQGDPLDCTERAIRTQSGESTPSDAGQPWQVCAKDSVLRETTFVLGNDLASLRPFYERMENEFRQFGMWSESQVLGLVVALREAVTNAIWWGNLELPNGMRDMLSDEHEKLEALRKTQAPYRDRKVSVVVRETPELVTIIVRDHGPGFNPKTLPDPMAPDNWDKAGGRGILLMTSLMDEVRYNDVGNEVTLVKRR